MKRQICIVPKLTGLGGMVSFQAKFIQGLRDREIAYTFDLTHADTSAILIIGGTRQLWKLLRTKQRGIPIIQRLNGMNWMHHVEKTPIKAFLRAELNNWLLAIIRRFIAKSVIYQSAFSQEWWRRVYGETNRGHCVVYNGVDLTTFSMEGVESPPKSHDRLLLVEGHLSGANAKGLETAVKLALAVKNLRQRTVELVVVGDAADPVKAHMHTIAPDLWITWRGVLPHVAIPAVDRSAHVLFSADLNAACPNSVIEALACGLPVLAYDTGALNELVRDGAGKVVPYGANHWQLEAPNIHHLAAACVDILENNAAFRQRARCRAEAAFGLEKMVTAYLDVLEDHT